MKPLCYDCGSDNAMPGADVCAPCLEAADALEYERLLCRAEHGDCVCYERSEAAMVLALRMSSPLVDAARAYCEAA